MRVAVIHNLIGGGAHRRLAQQVAALDADVVEVTTSFAEPVTARPYVIPFEPRAQHRPALTRPAFRHLDLQRLAAAWTKIGELTRRCGADVVYANPDSALRGALPCGPLPVPVLRYCDEPRRIDYEPHLRATLRRGTRELYAPLRAWERRLDRAAVAAADALATNSQYTAERIQAAYGRGAVVVPCGVPAFMVPQPGAQPRHLLSVGALIPTKGHDLVVQAAARSQLPLPLVIVAHRGNAAEERRLRALAAASGVQLEIRIGISDKELVMLYQDAYATLYLAAAEPLGLASLEAQACGSPVVVAAEGGLPETIRPRVTGFAVARDPAAAAEALVKLAEGERRTCMAEAAARHGATVRWSICALALRETLADLIATSTAKHGACAN
ncbi:glycosyltransferase [Dactylosporangium vinaceum]|uniref:Glycosyltransferase n=1 Tax=Dactylosporangium vinaceum TaxID=53362 RepID=A0ABV5MII7_9ACTN|nr:glycosyltransferase [Dactylosporangium vinaceum]UAB97613.1 glycosyltransferase [Dactylosporangium vinaceum]